VLVAAQGADRPVIVQKIKEAVMALFQLEAHKIKIMKMN
jgi:stage III sporulation protein AG